LDLQTGIIATREGPNELHDIGMQRRFAIGRSFSAGEQHKARHTTNIRRWGDLEHVRLAMPAQIP